MPKMVSELSPIEVKRLSHPGEGRKNALHAVGGVSGLYLQITPSGARSWIRRTTIGGKRRDLGLGGYPDIGLAQAREGAREAKDKVWRGIDPIEERKATKAALAAAQKRGLTFNDAFKRYSAAKLSELGTEADRTRWKSSIERYVLPHVGDLLVGDLTVQDVLRVLEGRRDRTWRRPGGGILVPAVQQSRTACAARFAIGQPSAPTIQHGQPVGSPMALYSGTMQRMAWGAEGPNSRWIKLECEGVFFRRNQPPRGRWTDGDQKSRYPGDKGFERTPLYATGYNTRWRG